VLKIFKEYSLTTNIFESFAYMDQREDYIRSQRNNNLYFLKYFQECCIAYQKDPENYSPQKKAPQAKKKGNNNKFSPKNATTTGANVTINFNKKQESTPQKKTYYKSNNNSNNSSKQKLSPTPSQNNKSNNANNSFKPKETSFPLSLAEQFGIKTLHKKNKSSKSGKKSSKDSSF